MIGMVSGIVSLKDSPSLLVNVHGVGYRVFVSAPVFSQATLGEEVTLFTHTHVREDLLELYGFITQEDLKLFELLIGVSGIGCKTALGVFSIGDRAGILHAILDGDTTFFSAVPRLGKKNAQKLIIELKNKVGGGTDIDLTAADGEADDVVMALKSFGFAAQEIYAALRAVKADGQTTEEKVRLVLKYLGK